MTACTGGNELREKDKQLAEQILELETEIAETEALIKSIKPSGVKVAEEDVEDAKEAIASLEKHTAEIAAELVKERDEKQSIELRFDNYRKKYPIR